MRSAVPVFVLCLTLSAPQESIAQSKKDLERAEARATEGKAYFKGKLFGEAAEAFMDAYAIVKKPALVYNAARAREENKEHKKALALFSMYTTLAGVDDAGRAAAKKKMATLSGVIAKAEAADKERQLAAARAARDRALEKRARDARQRRNAATKSGQNSSLTVAKAPAAFPLWRSISAGVIGLFGVASQVNALSYAEDARLENLTASSKPRDVKAARDAAQLWQGIALGSGVVAAGLLGWAGYDYFIAKKPTQGRLRAMWVAPQRDGVVCGVTLRL